MDLRAGILGTFDAYGALVQFDAVVPGAERQLMYGAANTQRKHLETDRTVWEVADFLPIALARPALEATGVKFDPGYVRVDSRGRMRTYRRLADEAVYRECEALAPEIRQAQPNVADKIAAISVERQFVSAALAAGSKAKDLEAGPPVLNGPDEFCDPLDQRPTFDVAPWWLANVKRMERPWWKFW